MLGTDNLFARPSIVMNINWEALIKVIFTLTNGRMNKLKFNFKEHQKPWKGR